MSLLKRIFLMVFSFRLIAVTILFWFLLSTPSQAWQQPNYRPFPVYAQPVNYRPYANPQPWRYAAPGYSRYSSSIYNSGRYQPVNYTIQAEQKSGPASYPFKPIVRKPTKKNVLKSTRHSSGVTSKQQFVNKLLPLIEQQNSHLTALRKQLINVFTHLQRGKSLTDQKISWLKKLSSKYRVEGNPLSSINARKQLLSKVDIIPASLTLAQAANESAWGKSRFATEANNLFGIWTYDEKQGLKPKNRKPGKKHLVRKFNNLEASVTYYMYTLNTNPAYKKLRHIRQQLRDKRQSIIGIELAKGLGKYSAKGGEYIQLIQRLIHQNEWALLDHAQRPV